MGLPPRRALGDGRRHHAPKQHGLHVVVRATLLLARLAAALREPLVREEQLILNILIQLPERPQIVPGQLFLGSDAEPAGTVKR